MIASAFRNKKIGVRVGSSLAALALVMTAFLSSSPPASSTTKAHSSSGSYLNIIADPAGPFADGFNPFSLSNSAYLQGATGMIYEPLMQFNLLKSARSTRGSRPRGRGRTTATSSSCTRAPVSSGPTASPSAPLTSPTPST